MGFFQGAAIRRLQLPVGIVLLLGLLAACSGRRDPDRAINATAAGFLNAANEAFEARDFQKALAMVDSADAHQQNLAHTDFLRGQIYSELNDFVSAQEAFERVLKVDPSYRGAWFRLGNASFLQGKYIEAANLYQRELDLIEGARGQERRLYKDYDVQARPRVLLQLGRARELLGSIDSARTLYNESIRLDSTNATPFGWLAELSEDAGDLETALGYAKDALRREPENPDFVYRAGALLMKTGKAADALPMLELAVSQRPWHEGAIYAYGQVLGQVGREEESRKVLASVDAVQAFNKRVYEAEAAAYQQARRLDRWITLADLYRASGRTDDARRALDIALFLAPNNLTLYNDMANLSLESGDEEGAVRLYRAVLSRDSTMADVWFNLGVAYARSGDMNRAKSAWRSAVRFKPGHAEARTYLSRAEKM